MPNRPPKTTDDAGRPPSPRPADPPETWTGEAEVEPAPAGATHPFPPPADYDRTALADALANTRFGPADRPADRLDGGAPAPDLSAGAVVIAAGDDGPGDLRTDDRYGIVLEVVDLDAGGTAYRVGWFDSPGRLYTADDLRPADGR